jgi:hypothetical protein
MNLKFSPFAILAASVLLIGVAIPAANTPTPSSATAADRKFTHDTYSDDEVAKAASDFFSSGAKELSEVLAKVLKEKGHLVAIIRGEEAGGAIGVGLRYGRGELVYKGAPGSKVYWHRARLSASTWGPTRSRHSTRYSLSTD